MQPVFVFMSNVPGLLYIGGKWVGEVEDGAPRALPVSPQGPVFFEYRPMLPGYLPMARRLTMSGGRVIGESAASQAGVTAVIWPCGATEIELSPEALPGASERARYMTAEDMSFEFRGGRECALIISREGAVGEHALPSHAEPPEITLLSDCVHISGGARSKRYHLCVSKDSFEALLSVEGDDIALLENGAVRVTRALNDVAGHVKTATYIKTPSGYDDPAYEIGAPNAPNRADMTPEDTALAAAEALSLGLIGEAREYFAPDALNRARAASDAIYESGGVTGMKYPVPGGKNAVGLIKLEAENLLSVSPLYYETERSPGGGYAVTKLSV